MKKIYTLSLLAFCSFTINAAFASEESNSSSQIIMDPVVLTKGLAKGEVFAQGNAKYTVYPQLGAIFKTKNSNLQKSLSLEKAGVKTFFETKHLKIFKANSQQRKLVNLLSSSESPSSRIHQVVLNNITGNFGLLTGSLVVKTKDTQPFNDEFYNVIKSYPDIGYYLVSVPENSSLTDTVKAISDKSNVESVVVEVIENFKEAL